MTQNTKICIFVKTKMRTIVFLIIVCLAIIAIVFSVVSGFRNNQIISQLEKTIIIKDDSLKILIDKINDNRIPFKFNYIKSEISFKDARVRVNDTLHAAGVLCAAGMTNETDVKTTLVYQVIPEIKMQNVVDAFCDSALICNNFFSTDLPIDSGVYGNSEYNFFYIPSKPGKYYVRGYFNIPSLDYHNNLHISKYIFQKDFEAY